jgi:hypothetical protein
VWSVGEVVCPRHGQCHTKLFPGAVKRTLSFTNFSISPERREALENILQIPEKVLFRYIWTKFISAQALILY